MSKEISSGHLYTKIAELLYEAWQTVVRVANQTMVYTYFEIGRMIVEVEPQGKKLLNQGRV
jgi:hypothetical protein